MLIFDASAEVFGHIATALHSHRRWARNSGFRVPAELVEFEQACVLRANKGQAGTPLDDLWQLREAEVVTRQLLPYEDAAVFLGCSPRHVKRLVADGSLPAVRVGTGSVVRIRLTDLNAFVDGLAPISGKESAA